MTSAGEELFSRGFEGGPSPSTFFRSRRKDVQTYLPSVAGVELAKLLSLCLFSSGEARTSRSQRSLPVFRSRHIRIRCCSLGRQVVRKTRSPTTAGEEWPTPGIGTFQ